MFPCGTGKARTAIGIAEEKDMSVIAIVLTFAVGYQWEKAIEEHSTKEWNTYLIDTKKKNQKDIGKP